jgi:hypothetical protein
VFRITSEFCLAFASLFLLFPLFFEPEELGAIRLLLESGAVMSTFALLGTNYSINRFFPYFRTEDKKHHGFFFWVFVTPAFGYFDNSVWSFAIPGTPAGIIQ